MLRGLLTVATFALSTTVLGLAAIAGGLVAPRANIPFRIGKLWSRLHLAAMGVRPVYTGLEYAAGTEPRIFLANHLSALDVWAVAAVLPVTCRFAAKRSLFWFPVLGQAMWAAGFIPIDRKDRTSAIASLGRAVAKVRDGASIILFPEGTRSRDGRLAPFKKGAFHLALEAGAPIVPIAISGSGRVVRPRSMIVRPGPVAVTFLAPVDPAGYGERGLPELIGRVRGAIAQKLAPDELDEIDRAAQAGGPAS